jgi:hypothetical protein
MLWEVLVEEDDVLVAKQEKRSQRKGSPLLNEKSLLLYGTQNLKI